MIMFFDDHHKFTGVCTSTAIGPHALMTAIHCNEPKNPIVRIDLSTRDYNVITGTEDDRDHQIILLDGPAFINYLKPEALLNVKPARYDETVTIYGSGGAEFPGNRKIGKIDQESQSEDPSDVDQGQKTIYYTTTVIGGDSGSAIFGEDGRVVGIVTYSNEGGGMIGFGLNFSPGVIAFAQTFSIESFIKENITIGTPHKK